MRNPLQKLIDFAIDSSREAETFFKTWAPKLDNPEIQASFAELAATERGRTEMLSRMIPAEMIAPGRDAPAADEIARLLVHVKAAPKLTLEKAIRLAIRRKDATAALNDRIAQLDGEACSFFRTMANEDRRTIRKLEACAKQIEASE